MSLKSWFVRNVRTAVGTEQVLSSLRAASCEVRSDLRRYFDGPHSVAVDGLTSHAAADPSKCSACQGLEVLPGTPYQKVLLPLDYLPSRNFEARWGYSRPPHQGLVDLFAEREAHYRDVVKELRSLQPWLSVIPAKFTHEDAPRPGWVGGPITPLDSALVYFFVQHHRPSTYLEIGSGVTTCFAKRAVRDHRLATRIVSIDPEPRCSIDAICDEVIRSPLETVDLGVFESLQPGDIVFMDGSHRSFMNSDVTVFMLDVMPLLAPGVIVHFHDILLPNDYPNSFKSWYWNEQYIVAVYLLAARRRLQILMPSAYVTTAARLKDCVERPIVDLGDANDGWRNGGSLWFTHTTRDA